MMSNGHNNGNGHDPGVHEDVGDFWDECSLMTVLTDPPTHELKLPGGQVVRLKTAAFFDVDRFSIAFVDAVGSMPPLPQDPRKQRQFLKEKFAGWLADRTTQVIGPEAGDRGTLMQDIATAIGHCAETEDPPDIDRGAVYLDEAGPMVSGRLLLERVRRGCAVPFAPAEFYKALVDLGCTNLGDVRLGKPEAWHGRAWRIPAALRPRPPALLAVVATAPEEPATVQPGIFDGLV
jgi:hypothetical protein